MKTNIKQEFHLQIRKKIGWCFFLSPFILLFFSISNPSIIAIKCELKQGFLFSNFPAHSVRLVLLLERLETEQNMNKMQLARELLF